MFSESQKNAASLLGIDINNYTIEDVKKAFREKAKGSHPDNGNINSDQFYNYTSARDMLIELKKISFLNDDQKNTQSNEKEDNKEQEANEDMVIPGTNIRKPRERGIYESDSEYVQYLENYYKEAFSEKKTTSYEEERKQILDKINLAKQNYKAICDEFYKELMANDFTSTAKEFSLIQDKFNALINTEIQNIQEQMNLLKELDRKHLEDAINLGNENINKTFSVNLDNNILIEDNNKNMPLGIEDKSKDTLLIEDKQKENIPLGIEDKSKEPLLIEDKQKENIPTHIEKEEPVKVESPSKEPEKKPSKTLDRILSDLTYGLSLKQSDNWKYTASNIKISENFKNSLQSGNYLYNAVHVIPSVIQSIVSIPRKYIGKAFMSKEVKDRIDELDKRINDMTEEEIMTIYREYRSSEINNYGLVDVVNTKLQTKITKFVQEKVSKNNVELMFMYDKINKDFSRITIIDRMISSGEIDEVEMVALTRERESLIEGKASLIAQIREKQIESSNWFSGGEHGFSEDMKAARTKMSIVGMRFSKKKDMDDELLKQQADYKDKESQAIKNNDDELALQAFLQREKLLSDSTKIENSVFGKRSVGDRYYSPINTDMDYRDDPFIRDLVTSTAVIGSVINTVGSIKNINNARDVNERLNSRIEDANKTVNQYGRDITSKGDSLIKGQEAQLNQSEINNMTAEERMTLDQHDWKFTDAYRNADKMSHIDYNQSFDVMKESISQITDKYQKGKITTSQALEEITNLTRQSQSNLQSLYTEYKPILDAYASKHPQFELDSLQEAMSNMLSNPEAIQDAANAQVELMKIGEILQQFNVGQEAVNQSIIPQIIGTASAFTMIANVSHNMREKAKTGKYGNEATEIIANIDLEDINNLNQSTPIKK